MRKTVVTMLWLAAVQLSAGNLLDNPSFEEGNPTSADLPSQWLPHKILSMENHHALDSGTAKTGKCSGKLTSTLKDGMKHYTLWMQRDVGRKAGMIEGGTEMELSAWIKTSAPEVPFRIYVEAPKTSSSKYHAAVSPVQTISGRGWKKIVVRFKLPEDHPNYYVCLQLAGAGTIWFDDVYFGQASEAPVEANRIENASAEDSDRKTRLPMEWQPLQINLSGSFHSLDKTAHSGESSLRLTCEDPKIKIGNFVLWIQKGLERG